MIVVGLSVPNENLVGPVANGIPPRRTAKLKQFADLIESGKGNLRVRVQASVVRRRILKAEQWPRIARKIRALSGGSSLVSVVQSTDLGNRHDLSFMKSPSDS